MTSDGWNNPQERTLVLQRAARENGQSVTILTCFFNPTPEDQTFTLPPPDLPTEIVIDSASAKEPEQALEGRTLLVKSRSVVLTRSVIEPERT
jgi:glycogen operon protein